MRALASTALLATVSFLATACGPTCQSTCERMYASTECDVAVPGLEAGTLISECTDICEDALKVTGPLSDDINDYRFDPTRRTPIASEEERTLANESESAAWMDCVWTFDDVTCPEQLGEQYCVWVY